jgi:hypothetical protein
MYRYALACIVCAGLLLGCRTHQGAAMHFLPTREILTILGKHSITKEGGSDDETFPIPVRLGSRVVLLVMYYKIQGPRGDCRIDPPHHAMHMDGETGRVLRFWPTKPEELGIHGPLKPVPGLGGKEMDPVPEQLEKYAFRDAHSPEVWAAYAAGRTDVDPATAAMVKQYRDTFFALTMDRVAPLYLAASPDYFQWLNTVAAGAR